jgi:Amt family ammonium transporter
MIAVGLFATVAVNDGGANGLFHGNARQLGIQILAILATMLFSFTMTYGITRVLAMSIGLRVGAGEEEVGLDISTHGERAYT